MMHQISLILGIELPYLDFDTSVFNCGDTPVVLLFLGGAQKKKNPNFLPPDSRFTYECDVSGQTLHK